MATPRKTCYLIAYDIREPRRLKRVHYRLSKLGLAIQYSVFVVDSHAQLLEVLNALRPIVAPEDDVRCYQARSAEAVWLYGRDAEGGASPAAGSGSWLQKVTGKVKGWFG